MSARDILSVFFTNSENLTPTRILLVLLIALAGGVAIWFTYRFTIETTLYSRSFGISNIIMVLLTTIIMLMISTNIVISLGMVGALSIVRFRTAVKDPRDTLYLFWSIVVGLCTGSQNFILAVLSTLFVSVILFFISFVPRRKNRYTLIVRTQGLTLDEVQQQFGSSVPYQLQAMHKSEGEGEYIFALSGKEAACAALAGSLETLPGVQQVNLVSPGEG